MGFIDLYFLNGKSAQSHYLLFVEYKNKKNNRPHFETGSLRSGEIVLLAPHLKNVGTYMICYVIYSSIVPTR